MKYWINTISRDHVQRGVAGGFTQANHGKPHMLKRLSKGDWIIFYSPKTAYEDGQPLQAFTALAEVIDDELYQVEMAPGFVPWRCNVRFKPSREVSIKPLIDNLSFITDTAHWGYMFRFGMFEIPVNDFERIVSAMKITTQRSMI
jgi:predicted RNA-binding protein